MADGQYDEAIAEYALALEAEPSMSEANLALGVLYELSGRTTESEQALAAARDALGSEAAYAMNLAQAYARVGLVQRALSYADEAVNLEPESPQAFLIRAGLYEQINSRAEALADLERATVLAQEQGEDEIYVLARMRYGMLLQQVPGDAFAPTTP